MKSKSEGVRRLSIFLGILGVLTWLIFLIFVLLAEGFDEGIYIEGMIVILVGSIVSYLIPFLLVKGIGWVILGFRNDGSKINHDRDAATL